MCDKIKRTSILLIFITISGVFQIFSINAQENPEVKAIQLFDSGKFKEAEIVLQELLQQKSDSPILNYYYGASLTENGNYGKKELEYLRSAGKNITPDRLNYYLAIQYHAQEDWDQALKLYNQFRLSVPEAEQKELELDKKIQMCFNQTNPFEIQSATPASDTAGLIGNDPVSVENKTIVMPSFVEDEPVFLSASTNVDNLIEDTEFKPSSIAGDLALTREVLPNLPGVQPTVPDGDPVEFRINNKVTYFYTSQFQTEQGQILFEKAQKLKQKQKEGLEEADKLRIVYKNSQSEEERKAIATQIIDLENQSFFLEEEIKNIFLESQNVENEYWENAGPVSLNNFLMQQEKLLSGLKETKEAPREAEEYVYINIIEPKSMASARPIPSDLTYKIQIGAYSKGVPAYMQRIYNKLSVIRTIDSYTDEKGVVVYTTGNLSRYEDALKMQNQVRQEGVQDASVVPYFNGKRITLEQAKQLEANNDI